MLIKCHYPDVSSVFNWSCHVGNLLQPIRSTTQIWEVTSHQYGVFALVPQTSFRGKTNSGVAECRLFSWAAFKSNHHHSELTNRNVALRDAHCNSRIWICRRKRYQRKEWEQRKKKGLYFWWYSVDCCAHVIGSRCARGKAYCTFNTRDISWDGGDIFCALNVGFGGLASEKQKNQHWEGRSTTLCRNNVYSTGCPSLLWWELVLENLSLSQYKSLV